MNIKRLLLLLMVMGFAVGCAATPEQDQEGAPAAPDAPAAAEAQVQVEETTTPGVAAAERVAAGDTSYLVERGDNLWSISGKDTVYGNPYQWPLIYKANRDQIRDADLIYPGQDLVIARGMSDHEINAAVHHAKTRGAWTLGEVEASDTAYLNE